MCVRRFRVASVAAIAVPALVLPGAPAATLCVRAGSPGPVHDGTSWNTAFQSLQPAVDAAAASDEIWVAAGVYPGPVSIGKDVSLYGGFTGTESTRDARNPKANLSILDAGGASSLVSVTASTVTTTLDGVTLRNTDRSAGVAVSASIGKSVTVSNCILTNNGTGVMCGASAVAVTRCRIAGNGVGVAGGGMATPVVSQCVLMGNETALQALMGPLKAYCNTIIGNGTALDVATQAVPACNNIIAWNGLGYRYVGSSASAPAYNCVFGNAQDVSGTVSFTTANHNTAVDPLLVSPSVGEVHLTASSPCIGKGGNGYVATGAVDWDGSPRVSPTGGAVDIGADEYDGTAYTADPIAVYVGSAGDDTADGHDAASAKRTVAGALDALFGHGGEVRALGGSLKGCATLYGPFTISGRWTAEGRGTLPTVLDGGIGSASLTVACGAGQAAIDGLTLRGADAGIDQVLGSSVISNSVLCGNVDGLAVDGGQASLVNCTVAENRHGVAMYGGAVSLTNTIVALNGSGIYRDAAVTALPAHNHNCIAANDADYDGVDSAAGQFGNIAADPLLFQAAYGDYHLTALSPCLGAGDAVAAPVGSLDMDGQPRLRGGAVDIGADCYDAAGPAWPHSRVWVNAATGSDFYDGLSLAQPKKTIGAAIAAAGYPSGGLVSVVAGTYAESLTASPFVALAGGFSGQSETETPNPAANVTVVQAADDRPVVSFVGGHTSGRLRGFTLFGGLSGVLIRSASPTIEDTVMRGSAAAVDALDASPVLRRNTALLNFDGLSFQGGHPVLSGNTVRGNTLRGIAVWDGQADARGNALLGNGDSGLYVANGSVSAVNNTLMGSQTGALFSAAQITLANSIVCGNGTGISAVSTGNSLSITTNVFSANAVDTSGVTDVVGANGNVSADPQLASVAYGDAHLQPGSPCRGAADAALLTSGQIDMDGEALPGSQVDIGADQSDGQPIVVTPAVVRVSPLGDDAADGATWAGAKASPAAAASSVAATGGQVWVAIGSYAGSVTLPPFVHAYGGFAGSETALGTRNRSAGATVLDGTGQGWAVKVLGGGPQAATLDGFTVSNARTGISSVGSGALIAYNTISANTAAGFTETGGASRFTGNMVSGNAAAGVGFGVNLNYANTQVTNNTITSNGKAVSGVSGGVYATGGAPVIAGNLLTGNEIGVQTSSSAAKIVNNTFLANKYGVYYITTEPSIANNIVQGGTYGIYASGIMTSTMWNNDVFGASTPFYGVSSQTGKRGNIAVNPQFRDAAGNLRLAAGSPCIDTGDDAAVITTTDLDGRARILGAHVDMGAYEYLPPLYTVADAADALRIAGGAQATGSRLGCSTERRWGGQRRPCGCGAHSAQRLGGGLTMIGRRPLPTRDVADGAIVVALTAFSSQADRRQASICFSNLRRIGAAARMYEDDYDGKLVPYVLMSPTCSKRYTSLLFPYVKDAAVFRCPSDHLKTTGNSAPYPSTYGINWYISSLAGTYGGRVNAAFYDGHAESVPASQFDPNVTQWGQPGCLWDNVAG